MRRRPSGIGRGRTPPRRARTRLGREGERIRLVRQPLAIAGLDLELVEPASLQARQEDLPDAAFVAQAHGVAPAVPVVEVADDRDPAGVRRPDGECHAVDARHRPRVGAQLLPATQVAAFRQQLYIVFREDRREAIGILDVHRAAVDGDAQPVGEPGRATLHRAGVEAFLADAVEPPDRRAGGGIEHGDRLRPRQKGANDHGSAVPGVVHAEEGERVAMIGGENRVHLVVRRQLVVRHMHRCQRLGSGRRCRGGRFGGARCRRCDWSWRRGDRCRSSQRRFGRLLRRFCRSWRRRYGRRIYRRRGSGRRLDLDRRRRSLRRRPRLHRRTCGRGGRTGGSRLGGGRRRCLRRGLGGRCRRRHGSGRAQSLLHRGPLRRRGGFRGRGRHSRSSGGPGGRCRRSRPGRRSGRLRPCCRSRGLGHRRG